VLKYLDECKEIRKTIAKLEAPVLGGAAMLDADDMMVEPLSEPATLVCLFSWLSIAIIADFLLNYYLFMYVFIYLFIYLFILFIYLFNLFIYLCIYLLIYVSSPL
jgi:hypothetical protein